MLDTVLDTTGRKNARFALGGGSCGDDKLLSPLASHIGRTKFTLCIKNIRLMKTTTRLLLVEGHRWHRCVERWWARSGHLRGLSVMLRRLQTTTVMTNTLSTVSSTLCSSATLKLFVLLVFVCALSTNKGVCER